MLKKYFVAPVFICMIAGGQVALADDASADSAGLTFVPSIGYQNKHLKFEQSLRYIADPGTGPTQYGTNAKFDVDLPTANLSLTSSYKRMFLTLKYEKNLADGITNVDETLQPTEDVFYFNGPGGHTKISREDMNITLGYNLFSSFNIFAGYMRGRTEITPENNCQWTFSYAGSCFSNVSINKGGDAVINLAWLHNDPLIGGVSSNAYHQTYTEKGPYVGFSYAFQIADAGTLSFSAAYAQMNGVYKDNFAISIATNTDFEYTGDSTGTSFGLTWTAPLGERSNYFIDLRQQNYSMDAKDHNGNYPGGTAKTDETMQGITAGVQLYY